MSRPNKFAISQHAKGIKGTNNSEKIVLEVKSEAHVLPVFTKTKRSNKFVKRHKKLDKLAKKHYKSPKPC
jgi:ribosomal protein L31